MPWHIDANNEGCDGYAVVKDATGELEGCHRTRAHAERQLAALYAAEPQAAEGRAAAEQRIVTDIDGTIVTAGSQPIQSVIDEINAAGIPVYVLTGRSEARRQETANLLNRLGLHYNELYMVGSQSAKLPQIDEWAAEYDIVKAFENDPQVRAHYRSLNIPVGGTESREAEMENPNLNQRQQAQYQAIENVVEIFGQYDQTSGPDGAHYAAPSPFAGQGLVCANCVYYEGGRQCELVAGDIDPAAICKLWIIPGNLVSEPTPRAKQVEEMLAQLRAQR